MNSRNRLRGTPGKRIAWPPTLAAMRQDVLRAEHLRFVREAPRGGVLHCFVLDCSGSMLAGQRLALAKGLLIALFDRASAARAEAALICFGGNGADVRFGPAVPRWWNERWLRPVGGGGGTPLASGVREAARLLERSARRRPAQQRWLWILTDGRSSDQPTRPLDADEIVFVDFEREAIRVGRCETLADAWDARRFTPEELIG
ncbi:UNVERIFIED_ORG: magnesium chelatase subunit ChlD-like protein [Burkholderia sp. 1595]|uniref:Magnesium chelatase subunit ChlD-like protein n=2 Tax=Paraburkholderia terricola TaxID=169427 RepID=A0ABU1LQB4_9BURK|nr:magnesium chelatase subunit ChlD-like protein [Paraburkholderia terricola]MDR6482162.1 magnesium chelatase subunit ChlD-like protein [Paraburkholderia terricola]